MSLRRLCGEARSAGTGLSAPEEAAASRGPRIHSPRSPAPPSPPSRPQGPRMSCFCVEVMGPVQGPVVCLPAPCASQPSKLPPPCRPTPPLDPSRRVVDEHSHGSLGCFAPETLLMQLFVFPQWPRTHRMWLAAVLSLPSALPPPQGSFRQGVQREGLPALTVALPKLSPHH